MRIPETLMSVIARHAAWMPPLPETRGIAFRRGVSTG
ncbi:hypothetical protein ABID82_007038 [Methylobacterium sp. PvP062]